MYNNQFDNYGGPQHPPPLFDDTSNAGYSGYGHQGSGVPPNQGQPNFNYQQNQGMGIGNLPNFPGSQFVQDPLVANMAMQYGQNLVGHGKEFVDAKLEKYVSVNKLKYYFAVDTSYVIRKLRLIFFPYTHSDWSVRYDRDEPVQPRHDINAPDLYIPLMGFVTYILVAGFYLGLQNRFSPDILGMLASWAVVWLFLELVLVLAFIHITSLTTRLHALHLLALASYKYVGMIFSLFGAMIMSVVGYFCVLGYCGLSLVVFLFRTLRWQIQGDSEDVRGYSAGNKRRFYLLIFMSGIQPVMMWWLTWSLVSFPTPELSDL